MRQTRAMFFFQSLFLFLILFGFIFSPRVNLGVVIHLGFFSVFFLAIVVAFKQRRFALPRPLLIVAIFFLSLAIYHLALAVFFGNNPIYFISICISVVVYVVFGWIVASFLAEWGVNACALIDRLIMMCAVAVFVNSVIILVEYLSPDTKFFLESMLLNVESQSIYGSYAEHPFLLRGLSSAGGAGLSVVNALAILLFIFLVVNKKISSGTALFCSLVIVLSTIFIGRTGLIFGLLFLFVLLVVLIIQNLRSGLDGFLRAVALILFLLFTIMFALNFDFDFNPEVFNWAFEWVDGLLSGRLETASSDDLKSMLFLPDNPLHFLFGIGFFEGNNDLYPRTDSGYLKTILSVGVLFGYLLYFVIVFMFFRLCKVSKKYRWLVVSVLAFMLFVEVKEPFLYQNFAARVIFLLSGAALFVISRRRPC